MKRNWTLKIVAPRRNPPCQNPPSLKERQLVISLQRRLSRRQRQQHKASRWPSNQLKSLKSPVTSLLENCLTHSSQLRRSKSVSFRLARTLWPSIPTSLKTDLSRMKMLHSSMCCALETTLNLSWLWWKRVADLSQGMIQQMRTWCFRLDGSLQTIITTAFTTSSGSQLQAVSNMTWLASTASSNW